MNIYDLSRVFWDFSFDNPDKIRPIHVSIYFFSIEHCNRLGWKEKFGLPTSMVIEAIGIGSYNTYKKAFDDLVQYGFFIVHQYSKNQYSSNVIALSTKVKALDKATDKALDKALINHNTKHNESSIQSTGSIDKQLNNITIEQINTQFDIFWNLYGKKKDTKNCREKWMKMSQAERDLSIEAVPKYVSKTSEVKFRKDPIRWLTGKCWLDEKEDEVTLFKRSLEVQPLENNEY